MDEPRRHIAAMIAGLDIRYDVGNGHPLLGVWELPVLGAVAAPPAVPIRPDGHVAWAGDLNDPDLPRALATWFGAPTPV